jgi:hypothetical protein
LPATEADDERSKLEDCISQLLGRLLIHESI